MNDDTRPNVSIIVLKNKRIPAPFGDTTMTTNESLVQYYYISHSQFEPIQQDVVACYF